MGCLDDPDSPDRRQLRGYAQNADTGSALFQVSWPDRRNLTCKADTKEQMAFGADIVLEPFQDAADRAVDLLSGGERLERMSIPDIETEGKAVA